MALGRGVDSGEVLSYYGEVYSQFCGEVVYSWGKYSGFREKCRGILGK